MKSIITRIKFNDSEWDKLTKILNDYCWGFEVTKLRVKWADRINAWLEVQALDEDNNILYSTELLFY